MSITVYYFLAVMAYGEGRSVAQIGPFHDQAQCQTARDVVVTSLTKFPFLISKTFYTTACFKGILQGKPHEKRNRKNSKKRKAGYGF
jgi:hypothetical protein